MMHAEDFKVLTVAIIGVVFSYVETTFDILRFITVLLSIGYTVHRWFILIKKNRKNKEENNVQN